MESVSKSVGRGYLLSFQTEEGAFSSLVSDLHAPLPPRPTTTDQVLVLSSQPTDRQATGMTRHCL